MAAGVGRGWACNPRSSPERRRRRLAVWKNLLQLCSDWPAGEIAQQDTHHEYFQTGNKYALCEEVHGDSEVCWIADADAESLFCSICTILFHLPWYWVHVADKGNWQWGG
mmetsp:Transcript_106908/g.190021  ORF Transcript_106908/g.190021 Transcript_106908/m.190021 type:complete len:110 (-) Transcript_106908:11-340(-)